ncbi:retrovirus-related pol polyprotein from transposon TNT 1-94 [Tanacetum coccineum]|uniref:Retrovirus-related pol polyprotein from transposon TNT 1-94 n=1 Tax=Tanacetum coccineum TaxID=301880 RepID=A0ABQ5IG54_9ASTR
MVGSLMYLTSSRPDLVFAEPLKGLGHPKDNAMSLTAYADAVMQDVKIKKKYVGEVLLTQQSQAEFPQLDSSLAVPMFQQGEDPIECINKAMAFLSAIASRQNQSYAGTENRGIATTSKGNVAAGQPRVVKCYNCQREGHMARQCTQPKRPRNAAWFKEKLMLAEAQEAGQILDEEQLAFLADPSISEAPVAQQTIPQNLAFRTDDLDAYDSDCNDYSEQTHVDDFQDNEIHSDSNIISYSQYMQESQDAVIQDTNPSAPNDLLVLSLVEQMTDHVAHLDKENQTNKMVNESLTADLERNAKLAAFQQEIDTLKETLSNNVKENESLSKTLTVFKTESKEKESNGRDIDSWKKRGRSKLIDKQNDPISIEKKIKISLINYSKLNMIKEDFGKCFVTQKELSAKQAFWLKYSSLSETPIMSHTPVRIEAPSELPKAAVDQCFVDKNVFEIQIKQLRIDNDQLLNQIMSQEIVHIVANSVDILDVKKSCVNNCNKCLELETELFKRTNSLKKKLTIDLSKVIQI